MTKIEECISSSLITLLDKIHDVKECLEKIQWNAKNIDSLLNIENAQNEEIREELANYAHATWSGWMDYLFSKCVHNPDGTVTIPKWAVERWQKQAATEYIDLPEDMKPSDRKEADRIIKIFMEIEK